MLSVAFCTTAMPRPRILRQTYQSFSQNLTGIDFKEQTLFLNIDPVASGKTDLLIIKTLQVARQFFGEVICRIPREPNFTAAVDWCWTTADTDAVFHLEDDWELQRNVSWSSLVGFLEAGKKQAIMRAYTYPYDKVALGPSLLHRDYYKRFAGHFDYSFNPEVQLRKPWVEREHIQAIGKQPIIRDLGRQWMKGQPFKRPSTKAHFTSWVGE